MPCKMSKVDKHSVLDKKACLKYEVVVLALLGATERSWVLEVNVQAVRAVHT